MVYLITLYLMGFLKKEKTLIYLLYKRIFMYVITKSGDFPKGNLFSREWHIRVHHNLLYVIAIEHDVEYKKIKAKLNHITIEDVNKY